MKTKVQILFKIELLNNFYHTAKWKDVLFTPLPETLALMKQYEMSFRQIGNELLVIAKTDNSGEVWAPLPAFARLSFAISLQTSNYLNFTNCAFSELNVPTYCFNNLNANNFAGKHFLTKTIANYKSGILYHPGDFVKAADGKIYEAITNNAGTTAPDNTKSTSKNKWFLHGDVQFANANDTTQIHDGTNYNLLTTGIILNFDTTLKQKEHNFSVFGFNPVGQQYNKLMISDTVKFEEDYDCVQINLKNLPSGIYRIKVNDDTKFVYFIPDNTLNGQNMFVDIYNLPSSDIQAYLDGTNKPLNIKYTIAFAARRVLWRYTTRTTEITSVEDTSHNFTFIADGLKQFISEKPIPLSDAALKTLVAKHGSLTVTSPLPNPQSDRLLAKKNEIYTTETFINF
jgi:hypothetical protein